MKPVYVMEPKAKAYDPALYEPAAEAVGVDGYAAVGEAQIQQYGRQGFLVIRGAFSEAEVSVALGELDRMLRSDDPDCSRVYYEGSIKAELADQDVGGQRVAPQSISEYALGKLADDPPPIPADQRVCYIRKVAGFTHAHEPLTSLARQPAMLGLLERMAGEPVKLFQDMCLIKPPGGREKAWHQDHAYFNVALETQIFGAWIAMHDSTRENGCMCVLAGAHRDGPRVHFHRRDWQICDEDIVGQGPTAVPMRAGDLLLFDGKLPHGTPQNNTDKHRWAAQFHYIPLSAIETDDEARMAIFGSEGKDVTC